MARTLKDQAAIVGIGQTEFSKNSGRSELQLACEAVRAAIRDAGLKPSDVDGMTTFTLDTSDDIEIARSVGIGDLTFFSRTPHGGGAALGIVHQAVLAVATGAAEVVVCYRALNGRSGQRYSQGVAGDIVTSDLIHWSWYMPFGLMTPASWVAMFTQRYMHETGCKSSDLAQVAVSTRKHAVNEPERVLLRQAALVRGAPELAHDRRSAALVRLLPGDGRRLRLHRHHPRARARSRAARRADPRHRAGGGRRSGSDDELLPTEHRRHPGDGSRREAGLRDSRGSGPRTSKPP